MVVFGLFFSSYSIAQLNADQLIRINNVASASEMNNISSPHEGSLLYLESQDNLYIRNGNRWNTIWTNQGNTATDSCFIGPISNHDFSLRTNNVQRMVVKKDGKVGVNISNPTGIFQVNTGTETTNNLATGGTASASSTHNSNTAAKARDGLSNTRWSSASYYTGNGNRTEWLKVDFGANIEKIINKYRVNSYYQRNPTRWQLQGSNNNSDWIVLDNRDYASTWGNGNFTFSFLNSIAYRYYRIHMTRIRHYNGYWLEGYAIIEFELFLAGSGLNFIVANDRNVGIGINPTHKLHVEGNILATGTITPDYVFENYFDGKSELNPEYEFTPLEKAEQFVKKNKHLPGVPSAANIETRRHNRKQSY